MLYKILKFLYFSYRMEEFDKITTQMKKGILEYLILSIISQGEVYANEILSQLKNANLIVVEGTLYPLLSRLKTEKFLEYRWVESLQGPPRKYYQLTEKGKMALEVMDQVRRNMVESVEKIVGGE